MAVKDIVVPLPEDLYVRLEQTAHATKQSITDVLVHAVRIGSPPNWSDAPAAFQADLAALDRVDDDELWRIARSQRSQVDSQRLQDLLEKNAEGTLTPNEQIELNTEISGADRFMLRKAYAAALLHWRGHGMPVFPIFTPLHQEKAAAQLQQFIDRTGKAQTNDNQAKR